MSRVALPQPARRQGASPGERATYWGGNGVTLLTGGDTLFPAMVTAIDAAQDEVWLATYIYHDDADTRPVTAALVRAAQRGVRVQVVVDGFGSAKALFALRALLEPAGVALAVFRPLERWWNWLQSEQLRRLHQKLCVVDDARAFVGGINLLADRLDINHGPTEQPRLDFALAVTGPLVDEVRQTARAVWLRATLGRHWQQELGALWRSAEPLALSRRLLERLRIVAAEPAEPLAPQPLPTPVRLRFVVRDNVRQRSSIEQAYTVALLAARERVDIVCPYFYPRAGFRGILRNAARRGVRVRLLLQGKVDYRLAGLAARAMYRELLGAGVEIYEYKAAYLHAKVACIDANWATVGSSNIDPLSLVLNLEANVVVDDTCVTGELRAALERAFAQSEQVKTLPPDGVTAWLARSLVATATRWYLRVAGVSRRY
ncbi:MAG: cardiolipin synthase ClsB [Proteobacteria bacterium]|nr:cardiolipin synthase ClsB [Pseudomonadota bacterium]